jgi:hypothetical protein
MVSLYLSICKLKFCSYSVFIKILHLAASSQALQAYTLYCTVFSSLFILKRHYHERGINRMVHNLVHHVVIRPILRILYCSSQTTRKSEQKICIIVCLQIISRLSRTDSLREAISKQERGTLFDRCEEFSDEGFAKITHICTNCT